MKNSISEKNVNAIMSELSLNTNLRTVDLEDNQDFIDTDELSKAIKRKVFYCEMTMLETADGKKFFTFEYQSQNEKVDDKGIWKTLDKPILHQGTYKVE
jgi:hypothetical protein